MIRNDVKKMRLTCQEHFSTCELALKEFFGSGTATDLVFQTTEGPVLAHRSFLGMLSSFLRSIFSSYRPTEKIEMLAFGYSKNAVQKTLEILYTGQTILNRGELLEVKVLVKNLGLGKLPIFEDPITNYPDRTTSVTPNFSTRNHYTEVAERESIDSSTSAVKDVKPEAMAKSHKKKGKKKRKDEPQAKKKKTSPGTKAGLSSEIEEIFYFPAGAKEPIYSRVSTRLNPSLKPQNTSAIQHSWKDKHRTLNAGSSVGALLSEKEAMCMKIEPVSPLIDHYGKDARGIAPVVVELMSDSEDSETQLPGDERLNGLESVTCEPVAGPSSFCETSTPNPSGDVSESSIYEHRSSIIDGLIGGMTSTFEVLKKGTKKDAKKKRSVDVVQAAGSTEQTMRLKKIVIKQCKKCQMELKGMKAYRLHLKYHNMQNKHQCRICPVRLKTLAILKQHEKAKHNISQLNCQLCDVKFYSRIEREQHILLCTRRAAMLMAPDPPSAASVTVNAGNQIAQTPSS